jgi:hypothetical protein
MLASLGITRDEALLFTSMNDNQRVSCIAIRCTPFTSSVCQQFLTVTKKSLTIPCPDEKSCKLQIEFLSV